MSIEIENLQHIYSANTPFAYAALKGVNLSLTKGKITSIIGATGSGKSTLVQHLNALLLPTGGKLMIQGRTISAEKKPQNLKSLRKEVGLVFQFPEYQLFEETIIKDVAFGPKNFNATEEEALQRAKEALILAGIDSSYFEKSPLDLSGGQKRRVAIAGILAMSPEILVLDEPTAGLDPQGARQMMELFVQLNKQYGKTILIVTHDMEHVLNYCDEVVVMRNGSVHTHQDKVDFFYDISLLEELKILPPAVVRCREMLNQQGFRISQEVMDLDSLVESIRNEVKHHG